MAEPQVSQQPGPNQEQDPLPLLPSPLLDVADLWSSIRDECLQSASLLQLSEATINRLIEAVQQTIVCLRHFESHNVRVWEHSKWQVAILQMLALAASDLDSVIQQGPTSSAGVLLCWLLVDCTCWMANVFGKQQQGFNARAEIQLKMARMQLPHTFARIVAAARQQLGSDHPSAETIHVCASLTKCACHISEQQLGFITSALKLPPGSLQGLYSAVAGTLRAMADSQLTEHVASMLLPLAEVTRQQRQTDAGSVLDPAGNAANDAVALAPAREDLVAGFYAFDRALRYASRFAWSAASNQQGERTLRRLLQQVQQQLLGGPCVHTYLAARLLQALHMLDGAGCAGLPPGLPEPTPANGVMRALQPEEREKVLERLHAYVRLLTAGICIRQPTCNAPGQSAGDAAGDSSSANSRQAPMPPGRTFRLAMRVLRLATGLGGSSSGRGSSAGDGAATAGGAAPHLLPLPQQLQYPLPSPADADCAFSFSIDAICAATQALVAWSASTRHRARVQAAACQLLPPVIAVMYRAASSNAPAAAGATASGSSSQGHSDEAVAKCLRLTLHVLRSDVLMGSTAEGGQQQRAAAVAAGLLPALQACVAWVSPTRMAHMPATGEMLPVLCSALQCWAGSAALLAPERQAAALAVALRSSFASALLAWEAAPWDPALTAAVDRLYLALRYFFEQLWQGAQQAPQDPAVGRVAAFALHQWAVVLWSGYYANAAAWAKTLMDHSSLPPRNLALVGFTKVTATPFLRAVVRAQRVAGDAAASAAARADATRAVASWRMLLLRDMHLLDIVASYVAGAARSTVPGVAAKRVVDLLELAAYALPEDVKQHVAAGREAARSRQPPPCAAGCGPTWLVVDGLMRDLLGPARWDRPQLLQFLEGRSAEVGSGRVQQLLSEGEEDLVPPPPCEATLLEACANPSCTNQAYAAAAARSLDTPPLCACARCGQVRYCGRACQTEHWRAQHKAECGKGWWQAA